MSLSRRLWRRVAGTPGFEGELLYDPEGDWIAIILVNSRLGWRFRIWRDIERAVSGISDGAGPDGDRKARIERYVYELCLIYADQTGAMPGFTNSESETRFERFAHSIPVPAELKLTRNFLKACIRRVDAKRNPQFASDLESRGGRRAAE